MADYDLPSPRQWPPGVVGPTPTYALTPEAEWGRDRVRQAASNRIAQRGRKELPIETHVPKPWREVDPALVTGAARAWLTKALAAGGEVKVVMAGTAVMLVVKRPRIKACWVNGRTVGVASAERKYTLASALEAIQSRHDPETHRPR